MRARVIGVGSPFGDDAVGWRVVERLAHETLPPDVEVVARDRPGVGLLECLEDVAIAVIVDATRSALPPGTLLALAPEDLRRAYAPSAHALGVAEALALARALTRPLPRIHVLGIAIAAPTRATPPSGQLSPAVAAALGAACAEALRLVASARSAV